MKLRNVLLTSKRAELSRQLGAAPARGKRGCSSAEHDVSRPSAATDTGICLQSPRAQPEPRPAPGRACVRARSGRAAELRSPGLRGAMLLGSGSNIHSGITVEKLAMPRARLNGRMFGVCGFSQHTGITPPPHHPHPLHFSLTEKKFYLFCHPQKFSQIS